MILFTDIFALGPSTAVPTVQTGLTVGAESEDAYTVIRKHLNAALDGPNWQALIQALSEADQYIWELAQNAFNQLFLSTASGKYLRRKAADFGIQEYPGLGMSDDQFRELAIKLSTGRVTYISILEILESYYGAEALRAYSDTQVGPFALVDGQTLVFDLEGTEYIYEVNSDDFSLVGAATSTELAVALTSFFTKKGSSAYASVKTDPTTGDTFVRVYSGALGLRSSLAVVGGTAQPFVGFDTYNDVYNGTVTSADAYNWVYSLTSTGKTQLQLIKAYAGIKVNTASVKAGDYLVIGIDTSTNGWYQIESATYSYSAGTYTQTITLTENIGFTGTITQESNLSYRFYQPTVHLISNGNRTVVVSQSAPNVLDVQVPATANVDRAASTAGYIVGNTPINIVSLERKNGTVTVQTSAAHGLTANRQVEIADFRPAPGRSWVVPGNATNLGGSFVHALASTANMTGVAADISASGPMVDKLSDGKIIISGGWDDTGAAYAKTFSLVTAGTTLAGTTQASGAKDTTYTYTNLGNLTTARWDAGHSVLVAPMHDQVLVTGGMNSAGTLLSSVEQLSGSVWTVKSSMGAARALHGQVTLDNGNVLVAGGLKTNYQSTNTCELFQTQLNAWIPVAPMNVPRHSHKLHKLTGGNVLAIGGFSMSQPQEPIFTNIVGHWRFDSLTATTPDISGNGFNLTSTGAIVPGKMDGALELTGAAGDPGTYAPNATLRNTFLMTNGVGFQIGFWAKGFGAGNQALVYYENTAAVGADDNALFRLYEGAANTLTFAYQNGVLNTVGPFAVGVLPTTYMNGWYHIAVTGTPDGLGNATWRFYINGIPQTPVTGALPSGGANSFFSVGGSPLSGNIITGYIDDMRLRDRPLTASEIVHQYLQGAGYTSHGSNRRAEPDITVRRALESVELYDPVLNTWTLVNSMSTNRGAFESVVLDSGEIMVLGGLGYLGSPAMPITTPTPGGTSTKIWPIARLDQVEIYNPLTGKWRRGPSLPNPKAQFWSAKVNDKLYIGDVQYGYDYDHVLDAFQIPTDRNIYWLNLTDFSWNILPAEARIWISGNLRDWAVATDTDVVILGGTKAGGTQTRYTDAIVGDEAVGSSGGINGFHRVVTAPTSTTFTFTTEDTMYTSNLGMDEVLRPYSTNFAFSEVSGALSTSVANRAANVTTVTFTAPENTLAVYINSNDANFSSGLKLLTAQTETTISYAEIDAGPVAGAVYVSSHFAVPTSEAITSTGTGGIHLLSPTRWTQLSGESTTTVGMVAEHAYSKITVSDTTSFPDTEGYIILGLGTSLESKPLKYLEVISPTEILMHGLTATETWPIGTTVTLISLTVTDSIDNAFWVTGALAAQLAAEIDVRESVASDVDLNWTVTYPSDRGLGGEGAANTDATYVWGADLFDSGF